MPVPDTGSREPDREDGGEIRGGEARDERRPGRGHFFRARRALRLATFFFLGPALALPALDNAYSLGRLSVLMKPARRKRTADQSSSIATIRTGSKPAAPSGAQPRSRSISDL